MQKVFFQNTKCLVLLILALIYCTPSFANNCSGPEGSCEVLNCTRCTGDALTKSGSGGQVTIMSVMSQPISVPVPPHITPYNACIPCGCGDGTRDTESFEECDDRNSVNLDGCDAFCRAEYCGDLMINNLPAGEQCEDGNKVNTDDCVDCRYAVCGDGFIWASHEQCDDRNINNGDGCSASCKTEYCGDGAVNNSGTEQCDDGNNQSNDGCSAACVKEFCGDGIVNLPGEQCDKGGANGYLGYLCSGYCTFQDACGRYTNNPYYGSPDCCAEVAKPVEEVVNYDSSGVAHGMFVCLRDNYEFSTETYADGGNGLSVGLAQTEYSSQVFMWYAIQRTGMALGAGATDWGIHTGTYDANTGAWSSAIYKNYDVYGRVCWTCAYARINGCFVPETLITMADGSQKRIDQIRAGDEVLNPLTNKAQKVKSIIDSNEDQPIIEIVAGGRTIKVTQKHPMFNGKDFIQASAVKVGDTLLISKTESVSVSQVRELTIDPNQRVLNITLESDTADFDQHVVIADGLLTGDLLIQKQVSK